MKTVLVKFCLVLVNDAILVASWALIYQSITDTLPYFKVFTVQAVKAQWSGGPCLIKLISPEYLNLNLTWCLTEIVASLELFYL